MGEKEINLFMEYWLQHGEPYSRNWWYFGTLKNLP